MEIHLNAPFRPRVRWFLETKRNTSDGEIEAAADLVISLRSFAIWLEVQKFTNSESKATKPLQLICQTVNRTELSDTQLFGILDTLALVVAAKIFPVFEANEFRQVLSRLIILARSRQNILLKKAVLDCAASAIQVKVESIVPVAVKCN